MTAEEIANEGVFIISTVGSELYGTSIGTGDRDEIGVCIEPPDHVVGLDRFENHVHRDAAEGERSRPGDLDRTIYSLRKFASLALNGNPTILQLLYVGDDQLLLQTGTGRALQEMAWAFASKRAGTAFLGYMHAQRQRLMGERGQRRVKRPELEEAHGYDTKYAAHIARLAGQGIEYLQSGRMTFPLPAELRELVVNIRTGAVGWDEMLSITGRMEAELKDALDASPLPDLPDRAAVNEFLVHTYVHNWKGRNLVS